MTQDEIIEMANKVGCKSYSPPPMRSVAGVSMTFAQVEELIKLVAAKEREACAKMIEDSWMAFARRSSRLDITPFPELTYVAKAIRARGEA